MSTFYLIEGYHDPVCAAPKERFCRLTIVLLLLIPGTISMAQEAAVAGGVPVGERTMGELLAEAQSAFDAREYEKADMLFSEFVGSYRDEPQACLLYTSPSPRD